MLYLVVLVGISNLRKNTKPMTTQEIADKVKLLNISSRKIEAAIGFSRNNLNRHLKHPEKMSAKVARQLEVFIEQQTKPTISYLKCEYDAQLILLKSLGITIEGQLFEQAMNAVIFLAGELKGQVQKLTKENEELRKSTATWSGRMQNRRA